MMQNHYFDYAASTPIDPQVLAVYESALQKYWANPSATHRQGQLARQALENARIDIAKILNCKANELIFTASASESNNLAIVGILNKLIDLGSKPHYIYSGLEHASVGQIAFGLGDKVETTEISDNLLGIISLPAILKSIRPETRLISLMLVNNEIGTLQPVIELAKALVGINHERAKENLPRIYLHTDASQASQYLKLDLTKIGVDLMTLSGQKIYAPKGNALLYIKEGTHLQTQIHGGGQEHGLRSGTPNVPGIVALSFALVLSQENLKEEVVRVTKLRDDFIYELFQKIPHIELNGFWSGSIADVELISNTFWIQQTRSFFGDLRIPNNINFIWPNMDQQQLLTYLDLKGFMVSSGSSCASGSATSSKVIQNVANSNSLAEQAIIRITLGRQTNSADLQNLLGVLKQAAQDLRN